MTLSFYFSSISAILCSYGVAFFVKQANPGEVHVVKHIENMHVPLFSFYCGIRIMVIPQSSKLKPGVRFPYTAIFNKPQKTGYFPERSFFSSNKDMQILISNTIRPSWQYNRSPYHFFAPNKILCHAMCISLLRCTTIGWKNVACCTS